MLVKQIKIGGDRNFAYFVGDPSEKVACVIDPSYNPDSIMKLVEEHDYKINYVFNTHGHYDHTNGNDKMESLSGIRALQYNDKVPGLGIKLRDGAELPLGSLHIKILYTPGHTKDSICILIGDSLFTGDTLFVGKVGGTDFGKQARQEYDSLHNKILKLPDHIKIYPGHDYGTSPMSTIANEKGTNPFLLQPDYNSFLDLKKNWAEYKIKHGIK
jgi:glyoxylase-like metal-dependent hydrolase (beta-lactamase superfamily II)